MPAAGAVVTIPAGKTVVLDVTTPALGGLVIMGTLVAKQGATIGVTAGYVDVAKGGRLQVGTAAEPFTGTATFTLTVTSATTGGIPGMGTKVLAVSDGILDLHGAPVATNWTKLGVDVTAGATSITLAQAPGWKAGDRIVIAPSTPDQATHDVATIASITGATLTLTAPLKYPHFGAVQRAGDVDLDVRAEVGLLTKNILITGDESSTSTKVGAHAMFMGASTIRISNTEVTKAGQLNQLGRYPIHFHLMANQCTNCSITDSSIHDTIQRGIVVHDTTGVTVDNNVVYNTVGHNITIETAETTGNTITNNLALVNDEPRPRFTEATLLTQRDDEPANYWLDSGRNTVSDNVAAGSRASGYLYDGITNDPITFTNNVAHAAMGQESDLVPTDFPLHAALLVIGNDNDGASSRPPTDNISGLFAYQNSTGFWPEEGGGPFRVKNFLLADNNTPVQLRCCDNTYVSDSTWVNRLPNGSVNPDSPSDDDGGTVPFNHNISHIQYGSDVVFERPYFVGYTKLGLAETDVAPRIASYTITEPRWYGTKPTVEFPERNTWTIFTDSNLIPAGRYPPGEGFGGPGS